MASAQKLPPGGDWQTFETPHFRVHHPAPAREFSTLFADYLEEAYSKLRRDLDWELDARVTVLVRNDADLSDGSAAVFPFSKITVQAVPFGPTSSIGEAGNWIRVLAYHELTHIVANESTGGLFSFLDFIFGNISKINSYQPAWVMEGLATYMETKYGYFGRGRATYTDMVFRTAVRDGLLSDDVDPKLGVSYDRLGDGPPQWPGHATRYLYGYAVQQVIEQKAGLGGPGRVSRTNSYRVPFLVNGGVEQVAGLDYEGLWNEARSQIQAIGRKDLKRIRSSGRVTRPQYLTSMGHSPGGIVAGPQGQKIYFSSGSYEQGKGIYVLDVASKKVKQLVSWEGGRGSVLRLKGPWLLYSMQDVYKQFHNFSDLYLLNIKTGKGHRLTNGLRAFDPDYSPDFQFRGGKIIRGSVIYIKNMGDGNQALARWDGKKERLLYRGRAFQRLSHPSWGPGGRILFAMKRVYGVRAKLMNSRSRRSLDPLMIYNLSTRRATEAGVAGNFPVWTKRGRALFISNEGGVFNLYRAGVNGNRLTGASLVTNLETGAFFPAEWKRGRSLAMVYRQNGFELAEVRNLGVAQVPPRLAALHSKLKGSSSEANYTGKKALRENEGSTFWPSIWPKYWLPYAQYVVDGWFVGAVTGGSDGLGRHAYSLNVAKDTRANFPFYSASYVYDGWYPSLRLSAMQGNDYVAFFLASNRIQENSLALSFPFGLWSWDLGGAHVNREFLGTKTQSGMFFTRVSHSNMRSFPNSIDPSYGEKGHTADLTAKGFVLGTDPFYAVEARWDQRFPLLFSQDFFRTFFTAAKSTNFQSLASNYYVGGGVQLLTASSNYLVRGYLPGALLGRSIATANLEYWFPLWNIFRGPGGASPIYLERIKANVFGDVGSAEFVDGRPSDYRRWPVGAGVNLMMDSKLFYHFPVTFALSYHKGLNARLGGTQQVILGMYSSFNTLF